MRTTPSTNAAPSPTAAPCPTSAPAASRRKKASPPTSPAAGVAVLSEEHVGLVHHVARQLSRKINGSVDVEELVSAGALGLVQAAATFEPERGLTFSTFAVPRIRGSMLDELRRHDRVSRGVRRKMRAIAFAKETATVRLGREPRARELAAELGITAVELRQWELDIEGSFRVSLDRAPKALRNQESATYADAIADERTPAIDERISHEQQVTLLGLAIRGLRAQEQNVLALYYYEELTLQECAQVLGLSASRVSQIRSEAIGKLRDHLRPQLS